MNYIRTALFALALVAFPAAVSAVDVGPFCSLSASPSTITAGNSTTLTLDSNYAVLTASIDNGVGSVEIDSATVVSPTETTTYTATVLGDEESSNTCSTMVTVKQPGTLTIIKETIDSDGTFSFNITSEGYSNSVEVEVANEDEPASVDVSLSEGWYNVVENVAALSSDWSLTSVTCEYEGESEGESITNGKSVYVDEGETVICTFTNTKEVERHGSSGPSSPAGEVLGASTDEEEEEEGGSCSPLITSHMSMGAANDPAEVTKLQEFLNKEMGSALPVTGVFGEQTKAAVEAFQAKYWEEILQPWFSVPGSEINDKDDTTGNVFKTTVRQINNLHCPSLNLPMPELP